ncbi:MAG: hypothetical protein AAF799_30375 [Myxococcota bacterium]
MISKRWSYPFIVGGVLSLGLGSGCAKDEPAPVRVARQFAAAARYGDVDQVLEMVDRQTRARVQHAAERASDQVGGRRNIEPEEMLQVVEVDPRFQVASVELGNNDDQRATVLLTGADGTVVSLELVNEDGAWLVHLPLPRGPMSAP